MWGALLGGSAGPQALQAQWHGCAAGRPVGCGVQPVVCGPWLGREILPSLSSPDSAGAPCVDLAGVRFQRTEPRYTARPPHSLPPAPRGLSQLRSELHVYFFGDLAGRDLECGLSLLTAMAGLGPCKMFWSHREVALGVVEL